MTTTPPPEEENLIEPRREGAGGQEGTRARTASWGESKKTSNRYPHSLFQMASPGPHSQEPRATETPCSKSNRSGHARINDFVNRALQRHAVKTYGAGSCILLVGGFPSSQENGQ